MSQQKELSRYLGLLTPKREGKDEKQAAVDTAREEFRNVPLVWWDVKHHMTDMNAGFQQYAVMGKALNDEATGNPLPVLLNTNAPWSAFLCGSQGSGKSHALSCMLENCLLDHPNIGKNPRPLAGLVFHYDRSQGSDICEAAYLCSKVPTKVLVSASNIGKLKERYGALARQCGTSIEVEALELHVSHLDTERIKLLMAVGKSGEMPLYMNVVKKILREMALETGGMGNFCYTKFTNRLEDAGFSDMQSAPLDQRLNLLESFVDVQPRDSITRVQGKTVRKKNIRNRNRTKADPDIFATKPGTLTIIDLTDSVVDEDSACALFDICLSIFLSQTACGKIIALDEAHNYMGERSVAAENFTERLLKSIREQRHQGARVVIATQEPSINTRLIDLCNITMVHRCTSPAWYSVLKNHLAALRGQDTQDVFDTIVQLKTGESLLFCPTAAIGIDTMSHKIVSMNTEYVKFRTRSRVTADGGRSKLADGN
ncbi:hypothetical protein BDW02DRAFT_575229 [Decorospora gaudefroyi]|uniref:AAA+ ATPase domain-containing protein n=1 Tax=Decorospora gaudefroyi TaxID=184978 RepID=A0A6A5KVZ7_9PLEO|nr:hypothetical protein BDW02DRAFT_575229 [Decorospora gaudefroyi]